MSAPEAARTLRWGALAVVLAALLWAGSGRPGWKYSTTLHALALGGLVGAGVTFLVRWRDQREGRPPAVGLLLNLPGPPGRLSAGAAAALLLLLAILLASAALAEYPIPALRRLGVWVCLAGWVALLAREAGSGPRFLRLTSVLGGFGGAACVIALAQWARLGGAAPRLPLDNPNHNGALAAAMVPVLVALCLAEEGRGRRLSWGVLSGLAVAAAVLSRSTAAYVALALGLLTLLAGWIWTRRGGRGEGAAALAAALVVASLTIPAAAGGARLSERSGMGVVARTENPQIIPGFKATPRHHWVRLSMLFKGRPDVAVAARMRYARATLGALSSAPLLGFGPASVPLTFARHRLQVPGAAFWGEAVGQLHSVGLQRMYESGIAGLVAFAAWALLSLAGRDPGGAVGSRLRLGLMAAVVALAVAGAGDALETAPVLPVIGVTLLALLSARPEARSSERLPGWGLRLVAGAALLVALAAAADMLRADLAQRRAEAAALRARTLGLDEPALEALRSAAGLDPALGLYEHQAAYAAEELALARQRAGDEGSARALFEESERRHRRAAGAFPAILGFASQTGNFLLDRDRPQEAIAYLETAVALDYYDPLGQFYLGEAYRLAGREQDAVEAHARAVRYYPRLVSASLWSLPEHEGLRRRVLERVRALVLEESARPAPGTPRARLLDLVQSSLEAPPRRLPEPAERQILVHSFDAQPEAARSRHLFGCLGFPIENLPVALEKAPEDVDDGSWALILQGLPVVTAIEIEARGGSASPRPQERGRAVRQRAAGVPVSAAGAPAPATTTGSCADSTLDKGLAAPYRVWEC